MARPATQHEPTRARIVAIARQHIAERGVANLELAPVAAEAGLSAPTLYHYVKNRRALVLAALQAEVEDLLANLVLPDDSGLPSDQRLREFLDRQSDWLTSTPSHTIAFLLDAVLESRESEDVAAVIGNVFGHAESLFLQVAVPIPSRDAESLGEVARTLLAGVYVMCAVEAEIDVRMLLDTIANQLGYSSK